MGGISSVDRFNGSAQKQQSASSSSGKENSPVALPTKNALPEQEPIAPIASAEEKIANSNLEHPDSGEAHRRAPAEFVSEQFGPTDISSVLGAIAPTQLPEDIDAIPADVPLNRPQASNPKGSRVDLEIYNVPASVSSLLVHLGVVLHGWEFFFGDEGVNACKPGTYDEENHVNTIFLGRTHLNKQEMLEVITQMKKEWPGARYRLLGCNCQTFAKCLCARLGLGDCIPSEYVYFADMNAPIGIDIESFLPANLLDKLGSKSLHQASRSSKSSKSSESKSSKSSTSVTKLSKSSGSIWDNGTAEEMNEKLNECADKGTGFAEM